jgi:hypothetical protein
MSWTMSSRALVPAAVVAALVSLHPVALAAQGVDPACSDGTIVGPLQIGGDACQKALDLYRYMNVQLGTLIAGGNATLGVGGTVGGFGHVTVEARVNVLRASIPDVASVGVVVGSAQQSNFTTSDRYVPFPVVDASIGLFRGIPVGITTIGGLDALVNVSYVPSFSGSGVDVSPSGSSIRVGWGGRLGLLGETALIPGVSVTYLSRDLPTTTITATASSTSSFTVQDYTMRTTAWRVVASKHILLLGLAAGYGRDTYDASAHVTYDVNGSQPSAPIPADTKPTRNSAFADVSLDLPVLKIVGEVGRVWGGTVATFNTFDPAANSARYYGSVGLRLGF